MKIELEFTDPFDAVPRVLQILRLSNCKIVAFSMLSSAVAYRAQIDVVVASDRKELVERRLAGLIRVTVGLQEPNAQPAPMICA